MKVLTNGREQTKWVHELLSSKWLTITFQQLNVYLVKERDYVLSSLTSYVAKTQSLKV